jgi:hypothetical protein
MLLIHDDQKEIMELKVKPNNELFETYPNISNRKTSKQKQLKI